MVLVVYLLLVVLLLGGVLGELVDDVADLAVHLAEIGLIASI